MKPTRQILSLIILFFAFTSPVLAQNSGPYLGIFVGGQLLSDAESEDSLGTFNLEFRRELSGSIVLGWELDPESNIGKGRVELEYTRRSNRLDEAEYVDGTVDGNGDLTADSLLVNSFATYRNASPWTPYFGAGIGVARISAKDLTVTSQSLSDDDTLVFAYQFGTGVDVALTQSLTLDLGYRFFSTSKVELNEANGEEFETEYLSHSAMLGLRMAF